MTDLLRAGDVQMQPSLVKIPFLKTTKQRYSGLTTF